MSVGLQKIMHLSALAVLFFLCFGFVEFQAAAPLAREGVINLSSIDLHNIDPVSLDGEWEFYWNQLLTPEDFQGPHPPAMSSYMSFPRA
jgi:hypothetical protein